MRALLDVNVLIALLDHDHMAHPDARAWMEAHGAAGWASSPMTQNGCIRVMANPGYPNAHPVHAVVERLRRATSHPVHEFWSDDVSVLSDTHLVPTRIHGPSQLTDAYLLALAVAHHGRFVTFDRNIVLAAVPHATAAHLVTL